MGGMIVFALGTTFFHIALHIHGFTQGTIEMVVVDVVEHLVLPTEVETAEVFILQKVFAVLVYGVVEFLFVILIKGNADFL